MRDSGRTDDDRGDLERMGEAAGSMAGRVADFGMDVTGSVFRSASEMLGGWWSSDAPRDAARAWSDTSERRCRSHYESSAGRADGATQATHTARKSPRGAMQAAGETTTTDEGEVALRGAAAVGDTHASPDAASDGFAHARAGYQLGYVARRNPDYQGRSFGDVEPELRRVWESRAKTEGNPSTGSGSWPEVRGFVDFAYQSE